MLPDLEKVTFRSRYPTYLSSVLPSHQPSYMPGFSYEAAWVLLLWGRLWVIQKRGYSGQVVFHALPCAEAACYGLCRLLAGLVELGHMAAGIAELKGLLGLYWVFGGVESGSKRLQYCCLPAVRSQFWYYAGPLAGRAGVHCRTQESQNWCCIGWGLGDWCWFLTHLGPGSGVSQS